MESGTVPPPGPPAVQKKGLPTLAWVGIGCGTLLVIGVIVVSMLVGTCTRKVGQWSKEMQKNPQKAAAEMMVRFNPDLEMMSQDESTGEMTVRVKSSGEEITMSYKDIAEGKITVKDAEGNVTQVGKADMSKLPAWVPRYPGVGEGGGGGQTKKGDGVEGFVMFTTGDAPQAVADFFKEEAGKAGLGSNSESKFSLNGQETVTLECSGDGRRLAVNAVRGSAGSDTTVTVSYEEGAGE